MSSSPARPDRFTIGDLIAGSTIALDTSALLQQWRMSLDQRKTFRTCLDHLSTKIFVPYQVLCELERVGPTIAAATLRDLAQLRQQVDKLRWDDKRTKLTSQCQHFGIRLDAVQAYKSRHRLADDGLLEAIAQRETDIKADTVDVAQFLDEIHELGWWTGQEPDATTAAERERRARQMVKDKTAPAVADSGKKASERDRLGDCLIWFELLEVADFTRKVIVFVTEDHKPGGWVFRGSLDALEPNPDLVDQMWQTAGVRFFVVGTDSLITYYEQRQDAPMPPQHSRTTDIRDAVIRPLRLFGVWDEVS